MLLSKVGWSWSSVSYFDALFIGTIHHAISIKDGLKSIEKRYTLYVAWNYSI